MKLPPSDAAVLRERDSGSRRALFEKDSRRAVLSIVSDSVPILGIYAAIAMVNHWLVYVLATIGLGVFYHRAAMLGHEAAHFLLSSRRWVNDLLGNLLVMYPLGTTTAGYRQWHFDHHRYVGTDRDPELCVKRGRRYELPKRRSEFVWLFLGDCLGGGILEVFRLMYAIRPKELGDQMGLASYWMVVTLCAWSLGLGHLVAIHFVAIFTVFWAIFRFRGWTEHAGASETHRFRCGPWWRFLVFPHNTWLHYEHHAWPGIPQYNLVKARRKDTEAPVLSLSQLIRSFSPGASPRGRRFAFPLAPVESSRRSA